MPSKNINGSDLDALFNPASVAHIGASPKRAPGRFAFTEFLQKMGYKGALYPVNPNYQEILGLTCYPDIAGVPGKVDLAILALPAAQSIEVLKGVPAGKIKFVIIHTSGFSEIDKGHLEDEVIELGRAKGFRIIGPNCMGIFSQQGKLCFWQDHHELAERPGGVGFISQSGGLGVNVISRSIDLGIGIDKAVSLGNQIDVTTSEVIEYFGRDPDVRVIGMYVEDVKDGREFMNAIRKVSPNKPVLVWKGGLTEVGKAAARSHTGSMAGDEKIFVDAMRQAGAILIDNIEQMMTALQVLKNPEALPGPNLGIICPGGGNVVNISDAFSAQPDLCIPPTTAECRARLQTLMPEENVDLKNPVDPGAIGMSRLGQILAYLGNEPYIDTVITVGSADFFALLPNDQVREMAREGMANTIAMGAAEIGKPCFFLAWQIRENEVTYHYRRLLFEKLEGKGIACLDGSFREIAIVLSRLAGYRGYLEKVRRK